MRSNFNQSNEKYLQKLAILHTHVLDIVEAETFEELVMHIFDAIEATINPFLIVVGQVRVGAVRGLTKQKGEEIRIIAQEGDGMPLDGPGIIVRAVNTTIVLKKNDNDAMVNTTSIKLPNFLNFLRR